MYRVLLTREAEKQYKKQDRPTKHRINKAIENIGNNPHTGTHIRRLVGELEGNWRYRLGNLRIVYDVEESQKAIRVKAIKSRGDVY